MSNEPRIIVWFSSGAASAVAAKLTLRNQDRERVHLVRCHTGSEHADNDRFAADCERWFDAPVETIRTDRYEDTWDLWEKRRYLAGINGALCTTEFKVMPRLDFQKPTDIHVFGYTADKADVTRANRLRENYPELRIWTPLIDQNVTKANCLALIKNAGIEPPAIYALGFPNANCVPCVKATSPNYWSLVRLRFPTEFERMAALSRELDVRLCRIKGVRSFIDEIPADWPVVNPILPACDFLCHAMSADLEDAA